MGRVGTFGAALTKIESWWSLGILVMSTGALTWLGTKWQALASEGWAAVMLVALISAALIMIAVCLIYLTFTRHRTPPEKASLSGFDDPLKIVRDREYVSQTVPLDGREYVNCLFDNVTFLYEGKAHTALTACKVPATGNSHYKFQSTHPAVRSAIYILAAINSIPGIQSKGAKDIDD